jgi:hypothetical protein
MYVIWCGGLMIFEETDDSEVEEVRDELIRVELFPSLIKNPAS